MNLRENLQKKYVAFLDVLGFKELVYKRNVDTLETYFSSIEDTLNLIRTDKQNIQSLLISDSTILISPNTREDFRILLRAVQTIQAKLVQKDIWIRGAISFGEVFFDQQSNLIVGKGLVNAYLLENEAVYPRVIIDTSIIPMIAENRQDFYEFVNPHYRDFEKDKLKLVHSWYKFIEDDSFFIAYAHRVLIDSINDRNIHLIYNKIKMNLYGEAKHYKKFLWVKNYFMDVLGDFNDRWRPLKTIEDMETKRYIDKWWIKFTRL